MMTMMMLTIKNANNSHREKKITFVARLCSVHFECICLGDRRKEIGRNQR